GDRRGGCARGSRSDRARLGAAVAQAVALLQPDRRLRPPARAVRGDGRGVPAGGSRGGRLRYAGRVNVIVLGCGRVGSAIARQLDQEGWNVTAVDEKEEALTRLGENWGGGFVLGHGMDIEVMHKAGIDDAD